MKKILPFLMVAGTAILIFISIRKLDTKKVTNLGYKPSNTGGKTRGQRNNNPFNIRYNSANNWVGQIGSDGSFCVFDTMPHGIRAGGVLLRNYLKNGNNTIEKILSKFAPASENNTSGYIANVEKMSGINRTTVLKNSDLWRIAVPMMLIESRYSATAEDKKYFENV